MTTLEQAEAMLPGIERIRAIVKERPELGDRIAAAAQELAATDRWTTLARGRVAALRERLRAAAAPRVEPRPAMKLPHGVVLAMRSVGMAWGALMLGTLTVAIVSRASARRAMAATEPDADEIRLRTALGPMAFTSHAKAFRGGVLDLWYGGGFLDLREATLDPDGALLRVRAVFGGGQILVPETWRVTSSVRGIGGLRDIRPTAELPVDAPHLTITGLALFGGFAVQSEMPAEQIAALEKAVARETARDLPMAEPVPAV